MAEETAQQKIQRLEYVLDAYVTELQKLRQENERLRAAGGAHAALRDIYLDIEQPASTRCKAAAASIQHEVPKLQSVPPPLELTANGPTLAERHAMRLARDEAMQLLSPAELAQLIPGVSARNGAGDAANDASTVEPEPLPANRNGSDGDSS